MPEKRHTGVQINTQMAKNQNMKPQHIYSGKCEVLKSKYSLENILRVFSVIYGSFKYSLHGTYRLCLELDLDLGVGWGQSQDLLNMVM